MKNSAVISPAPATPQAQQDFIAACNTYTKPSDLTDAQQDGHFAIRGFFRETVEASDAKTLKNATPEQVLQAVGTVVQAVKNGTVGTTRISTTNNLIVCCYALKHEVGILAEYLEITEGRVIEKYLIGDYDVTAKKATRIKASAETVIIKMEPRVASEETDFVPTEVPAWKEVAKSTKAKAAKVAIEVAENPGAKINALRAAKAASKIQAEIKNDSLMEIESGMAPSLPNISFTGQEVRKGIVKVAKAKAGKVGNVPVAIITTEPAAPEAGANDGPILIPAPKAAKEKETPSAANTKPMTVEGIDKKKDNINKIPAGWVARPDLLKQLDFDIDTDAQQAVDLLEAWNQGGEFALLYKERFATKSRVGKPWRSLPRIELLDGTGSGWSIAWTHEICRYYTVIEKVS